MIDEAELEPTQAEYNAQRLTEERGAPAPEAVEPAAHEDDAPEVEAKVKEKPRPWKKPPPETVPYPRFSEVNSKYREEVQLRQQAETQLAEYRDIQEQASKIRTVDDIDLSQYMGADGPDVDRYLKDLTRITREQAVAEAREQFRQEAQAAEERRQRDAVIGAYQNKANEYAKEDPEYTAKEEYVVSVLQHPQNARFLDRSVLEALAEDENAPHIIAALAEDEEKLATLMMGPKKALRTIAELSIAAKGQPARTAVASVIPPKPAFTPAATKPTIRIPQTVDSPRTGRKSIEDMSPKEYAAYRAKGGSAW